MFSILRGKTSLFIFLAIALGLQISHLIFQYLTKFSTLLLRLQGSVYTVFLTEAKGTIRIAFVCSCTNCRSIIKFEMVSVTDFLILNFGKPCLCFQQLNTACLFMGRAVISSFQSDFDSVPSLLPRLFWCGLLIFFFKQVSPSSSFSAGTKLESLGILAYLCGPQQK